MNNLPSLEEIKNIAFNNQFSSDNNNYYRRLYKFAEILLDIPGIKKIEEQEAYLHHFYPKNLWIEEKNLELIYFTSDKIIEIEMNQDTEEVKINCHYTKDMLNTELTIINYREKVYQLVINFNNSHKLTLSTNDAEDNWKRRFSEEILAIHKYLS